MGLKLDWEIEAEQSQVRNSGEDEESRRRRRRARRRVLFLIVFVVLGFAAVGAGLVLRLRYVDSLVEQNLRDTVEAEVTALRIADRAAYLGLQRSASEDWMLAQEQNFNTYQALKAEQDVQLTGNILDVTVDGNRARVRIEEIVDGVPYSRVWFYWQYAEGWRHVPPDFTFWGDVQTYSAEDVTVRARTVDAAVASAMSSQLALWIAQGCDIFGCATLPTISVEIVPSVQLEPSWSPANPWALQVPSPSVTRARMDMPFDASLQVPVAQLLAERLVAQAMDNEQPVYPADAVYLRSAVIDWLADRFVGLQSDSVLVQSLASQFGDNAVGRLVSTIQPTDDIRVLVGVTRAASLDATGLDWRDFLTWRLNVERELISRRDEAAVLALYDAGDDTARNLALARYGAVPSPDPLMVVAVSPEVDANGVAHLRARVQYAMGGVNAREEEVIFRLVGGTWKRAN
jgi:hypothetical protein